MKSGISLLFLCVHLMLCSSTKVEIQMMPIEGSHVRVGKEYCRLQSLTETNVQLTNYHDILFYGKIVIGSRNKNEPNNKNGFKEQTFTVVFDTGSPQLWVSSALGDETVRTGKLNTYNHNNSATYEPVTGYEKKEYIIHYGQGMITMIIGLFASDQVTIGDITIKRQEFGETIHRENFGSALNRFDGILGLSFPSEDLNFYNFSVIPTMTREKLIEKQLIAFYFNRDTSGKIDGEVTFGKIDDTKFKGEILYFKTIPNGVFWTISLEGIIFDESTSILTSDVSAIVDTGTNLILGPQEDMLKIHDIIKQKRIDIKSDNSFNCEDVRNLPMITFSFQGKKFNLKGEDYTLHKVEGSKKHVCYIGFGGTVVAQTWILGLIFLENVYSVFDYENRQIGFAELA